MNNKLKCPYCGQEVTQQKGICPHCRKVYDLVASSEPVFPQRLQEEEPEKLEELAIRKVKEAKLVYWICLGASLLIYGLLLWPLIVAFLPSENSNWDQINLFEIDFHVQADGTLINDYVLVWQMGKYQEHPVLYVVLPNEDAQIISYNPVTIKDMQIVTSRDEESGAWLEIELPKEYYSKKELVRLEFKVQQNHALSQDGSNSSFYQFVPGWFSQSLVQKAVFRWHSLFPFTSSSGKSDQAKLTSTWEGKFHAGKYLELRIDYNETSFEGAEIIPWTPFTTEIPQLPYHGGFMVLILVLTFFVGSGVVGLFVLLRRVSNGKGFYRDKNGKWKLLYDEDDYKEMERLERLANEKKLK